MNKHHKILKNLVTLSEDIPPVRAGIRLAAAIVRKNEIISYGFSSYKTHPFQAKYGSNADAICLHAEIDAIKNSLKRLDVDDLKNCSLYVSRSKKNRISHGIFEKSWGLAKPCDGCSRAIASFNIKNVFYTTDKTGVWECL